MWALFCENYGGLGMQSAQLIDVFQFFVLDIVLN
jgi:hypothetical protein